MSVTEFMDTAEGATEETARAHEVIDWLKEHSRDVRNLYVLSKVLDDVEHELIARAHSLP